MSRRGEHDDLLGGDAFRRLGAFHLGTHLLHALRGDSLERPDTGKGHH
jgi:hypothetical protein